MKMTILLSMIRRWQGYQCGAPAVVVVSNQLSFTCLKSELLGTSLNMYESFRSDSVKMSYIWLRPPQHLVWGCMPSAECDALFARYAAVNINSPEGDRQTTIATVDDVVEEVSRRPTFTITLTVPV